MKKAKKRLLLLTMLIAIAFLPYLAVSQIITVNNNWLCFDAKAAQQLENDIKSRNIIDSINNIIIRQYDSIIVVKSNENQILQKDIECLENDNKALQINNSQIETKAKKEKRVSFLKGMGAGGLVIAIIALIF